MNRSIPLVGLGKEMVKRPLITLSHLTVGIELCTLFYQKFYNLFSLSFFFLIFSEMYALICDFRIEKSSSYLRTSSFVSLFLQSTFTISKLLAQCKGVLPMQFRAFGFAPLLRRYSIIAALWET